jgi:hypothetical protein
MRMGSPRPLERERGEGEGFLRISGVCRVSDPSPQSSPLLQRRGGKTGCGFGSMAAGFIKVPEMVLIALPLKRPFHTGVC